MSTTTLILPPSLSTGIIDQIGKLFSGFFPVIALLFGIILGFFVINIIIGLAERARNKREERRKEEVLEEALADKIVKKIGGKQLTQRKLSKTEIKAIQLHKRFLDVMSGKDSV